MKQDFQFLSIFDPTEEEKERILTALETIQITTQGYYQKGNVKISLSKGRRRDFGQVILYPPGALEKPQAGWSKDSSATPCKIQVLDCDSLTAAIGLTKPLVLNFADAFVPGGQFLYGAKTQEESLCRSSTLYASLSSPKAAEMYRYNKAHPSPVDSDYMLLSPEVCVFRGTDRSFLDKPYYLSVISAAAPDRCTRAARVPQEELDRVIKRRLRNLFTVAALHGYPSLVLGAWGCGAFGNDVHCVARCFYELLAEESYAKNFNEIVFAIQRDETKLYAFRKYFECKVFFDKD